MTAIQRSYPRALGCSRQSGRGMAGSHALGSPACERRTPAIRLNVSLICSQSFIVSPLMTKHAHKQSAYGAHSPIVA